jgi:hypothetical protein
MHRGIEMAGQYEDTARGAHKLQITPEEALELHARGKPGKIEIAPTKPLTTQRDLSLAYSPGVAYPCLEIAKDPARVYDYTAKANLVAVISNGTAVLGLGNLGPLGAKPVMEGKAVLFKRFADIDAIDLEVASEDVDAFVACVELIAPTFGGINLEDIRAPECFIIEQRLRERCDIPVFHDDQHGTAIIAAAGLLNALDITGRSLSSVRIVINGAGAAGIACAELLKAMGVPHDHVILCDTRGVIYKGREVGMNQWKSAHAVDTDARTLEEAVRLCPELAAGEDSFWTIIGRLSGAMSRRWLFIREVGAWVVRGTGPIETRIIINIGRPRWFPWWNTRNRPATLREPRPFNEVEAHLGHSHPYNGILELSGNPTRGDIGYLLRLFRQDPYSQPLNPVLTGPTGQWRHVNPNDLLVWLQFDQFWRNVRATDLVPWTLP